METTTQHEMSVMGQEGDVKVKWNPSNRDEVDSAEEQFKSLRKKGFAAFSVDPDDGSKGEQIDKFDKSLKAIIMIPPMKGGSGADLLLDIALKVTSIVSRLKGGCHGRA